MDMSKLQEKVKDREPWLAAVPGVAEADTTERLNNTGWVRWRGAVNLPPSPFPRGPVGRCWGGAMSQG